MGSWIASSLGLLISCISFIVVPLCIFLSVTLKINYSSLIYYILLWMYTSQTMEKPYFFFPFYFLFHPFCHCCHVFYILFFPQDIIIAVVLNSRYSLQLSTYLPFLMLFIASCNSMDNSLCFLILVCGWELRESWKCSFCYSTVYHRCLSETLLIVGSRKLFTHILILCSFLFLVNLLLTCLFLTKPEIISCVGVHGLGNIF